MTQMQLDKKHILVVDDDDRLRDLLKRYLSEQGYRVSVAANAAEARKAMEMLSFDAMVLDVMMPGEDGISLAANMPVDDLPTLILSARSEPEDRIVGLEAGVDDYLTKPFEPKELLLRLEALLKRAQHVRIKAQPVGFGDFIYDPAARQLTQSGEFVELTTSENLLLALLVRHIGEGIAREELARRCALGSMRSVDVHIGRLRKKIEADPAKPNYIQTIHGTGYGLFCP